MVERTTSFQQSRSNQGQAEYEGSISEAASRVRSDMERLVEGFDLQVIARRVEEFGRANPVGLALTALTVGVAAGILMRRQRSEHSASGES